MIKDYCGIKIDTELDNNLTEFSMNLLRSYYMLKDEESPQESFARAAIAFSENDFSFIGQIY